MSSSSALKCNLETKFSKQYCLLLVVFIGAQFLLCFYQQAPLALWLLPLLEACWLFPHCLSYRPRFCIEAQEFWIYQDDLWQKVELLSSSRVAIGACLVRYQVNQQQYYKLVFKDSLASAAYRRLCFQIRFGATASTLDKFEETK